MILTTLRENIIPEIFCFQLYPTEFSLKNWEIIKSAFKEDNPLECGYKVVDILRDEKGFIAFYDDVRNDLLGVQSILQQSLLHMLFVGNIYDLLKAFAKDICINFTIKKNTTASQDIVKIRKQCELEMYKFLVNDKPGMECVTKYLEHLIVEEKHGYLKQLPVSVTNIMYIIFWRSVIDCVYLNGDCYIKEQNVVIPVINMPAEKLLKVLCEIKDKVLNEIKRDKIQKARDKYLKTTLPGNSLNDEPINNWSQVFLHITSLLMLGVKTMHQGSVWGLKTEKILELSKNFKMTYPEASMYEIWSMVQEENRKYLEDLLNKKIKKIKQEEGKSGKLSICDCCNTILDIQKLIAYSGIAHREGVFCYINTCRKRYKTNLELLKLQFKVGTREAPSKLLGFLCDRIASKDEQEESVFYSDEEFRAFTTLFNTSIKQVFWSFLLTDSSNRRTDHNYRQNKKRLETLQYINELFTEIRSDENLINNMREWLNDDKLDREDLPMDCLEYLDKIGSSWFGKSGKVKAVQDKLYECLCVDFNEDVGAIQGLCEGLLLYWASLVIDNDEMYICSKCILDWQISHIQMFLAMNSDEKEKSD